MTDLPKKAVSDSENATNESTSQFLESLVNPNLSEFKQFKWRFHGLLVGILGSYIIGGVALFAAYDANRIQRVLITSEMALTLAQPEVTASIIAIQKALHAPPNDHVSDLQFLVKVQPLKRVLEAVGVCYSSSVCDSKAVVDFACGEVVSLHEAMEFVAKANNREHSANTFHGLLHLCQIELGVL